MTKIIKIIFSFSLLCGLCSSALAKPDVFFADSDNYNGAYLKHEFNNAYDKVKFIMSSPIEGINIPDAFYDFDELTNYIRNNYNFPSIAMREEFIRMMSSSFESTFKAKEFLEELVRLLGAFSNA